MRRKITIQRIVSCFVVFVLTILLLYGTANLTERKASKEKYRDFFNEQLEFDVLFFGTSHVLNGIFPMELWEQEGFTSYNFGGHASTLAMSYWVMQNVFRYKQPQVVVIDCYGLRWTGKTSNFSFAHQAMDEFPLNRTKIQAVMDLVQDDAEVWESADVGEEMVVQSEGEPKSRIGLLWNFSVYHARWSELSREDFIPDVLCEKGAESRIGVTQNQWNGVTEKGMPKEPSVNEMYLRNMIEDCKERGIQVLLTYIPFPADEKHQKDANRVKQIAAEYQVNYIDFLELDCVNAKTDYYDKTHLNPLGARKITKYVGEYLRENYTLSDHRKDTAYAKWNVDYERYTDFKNEKLREQEDMMTYMMLLGREQVQAQFILRNEELLLDDWYSQILNEIDCTVLRENSVNDKVDLSVSVFRNGQMIDGVDFRYHYDNGIGRIIQEQTEHQW